MTTPHVVVSIEVTSDKYLASYVSDQVWEISGGEVVVAWDVDRKDSDMCTSQSHLDCYGLGGASRFEPPCGRVPSWCRSGRLHMAADLDSSSAICSSRHSWHIGSDSGVESAPILFPAGIWYLADARLSGYQNPFCYISDLWHSIAELWQPLWFCLFSSLAFPMVTEWCCLCQWWYHWDKGWPLPPQFQLPVRSWRLVGDVWIGLDWICLTTTHVLQDILAVLHKWMCLKIAFIL